MTLDDATRLVLREGFACQGGILLKFRLAEEPTPEHMATLAGALEIVRDGHAGRSEIDGKLAYALFGLSYILSNVFDPWSRPGSRCRAGLGEAVARLIELVEEIYAEVAGDLREYG